MAFAEPVKLPNKEAGITVECSEGRVAGRLQAAESPRLVAVPSRRRTGGCDVTADGHAGRAPAQAEAWRRQALAVCPKTPLRSVASAQGACSQV